jgi:exonuclease SbcC
MIIKILNLTLVNFKGIKSLSVDFDQITNIMGDNGTGKTTIADGNNWLLFGKDTEDRKDFNIKTLDAQNNPIHYLDHEVYGVYDIDGRQIKLRKVLKEKWTKKKGTETAEFTGHETSFYYNDVPMTATQYQKEIDGIINEGLFKLITNPNYFNNMKWQDRRMELEKMAGTLSDMDIINTLITPEYDYVALMDALKEKKTVEGYKKQLGEQKKLMKEDLEKIPTRIDEANRSYPEACDYSQVEKDIKTKNDRIIEIDKSISDKSSGLQAEFDKITKAQGDVNRLNNDIYKLETEDTNRGQTEANRIQGEITVERGKITVINGEITALEQKITINGNSIKSNNSSHAAGIDKIQQLEKDVQTVRNEFNTLNASTFEMDENECACPTCKRAFDDDTLTTKKEELQANFNNDKQTKLTNLRNKGKGINDQINDAKANQDKIIAQNKQYQDEIDLWTGQITGKRNDIAKVQITIDNLTTDLNKAKENKVEPNPKIADLKKERDAIVVPTAPVVDNTALLAEKSTLNIELQTLNTKLSQKNQIAILDKRVAELKAEEKDLAQQIAGVERIEYMIEQFQKARVDMIEARTNGKFKFVKFRMFKEQINGGMEPCCDCMVNGVPYSDVNTAGRINAGIDIINALSDHYQVWAPIWIDNRESVINLLPCHGQIINLKAIEQQQKQIVIQ